jgi:PncC family amidohydrolase
VSISQVVGELLKSKNAMVSVAESCTGGMISHEITSVPGSSEWFKGSVVAYSNEIKENILQVDAQSLIKHGAVSEQVVRQMVEGVRKLMGTEYGIATSGIAGPTGGTPDKPVGMVWIAVANSVETVAGVYNYANNRERNIIRASLTALDMLRMLLMK